MLVGKVQGGVGVGGTDRVQLRPATIHTPWPRPGATAFGADMRHISKVRHVRHGTLQSQVHFELHHSSGGIYIVSKSINGTWVNQQHLQVVAPPRVLTC